MFLKKLTLTNFKNYTEAELEFCPNINCFVGNNGVGKTNILDAIYYLSFCKSYFNLSDLQNIRHGEDFFAIHGTYTENDQTNQEIVSCIQKRNTKKVFKLNKKPYERLADHIGLFPLVMISPYDQDLINEGSESRRKFIDNVISQSDKLYLNLLISYNRALEQRNRLLKYFRDSQTFDRDNLEIWDVQLVQLGNEIYTHRKAFLDAFFPIFQHYFDFISEHRENVSIEYSSKLENHDFMTLLQESLQKDMILQYTTVGVHKDDLDMKINNYPVKKFGSQGQQKSFVIAMKLAQFDYLSKIKGQNPILLLDDIFDKLDNKRVDKLIELVGSEHFGQVFITDTQFDRIKSIFDKNTIEHLIFSISDEGVVN